MHDKLVWSPTTFTLGATAWLREGFKDWLDFNAMDTTCAIGSPIAMLWEDVDDDFAGERMIEFGGRHCYRSWDKGRDRADYIRNIIDMEHGSVLEHASFNFAIQGVSRSLSHELVRHRVGVAISQESQRYVDAKDLQFVVPPIVSALAGGAAQTYTMDGAIKTHPLMEQFMRQCADSVAAYVELQASIKARLMSRSPTAKERTMLTKRANEAARSLLPNAAETRLLWSPNYRLLRHFLWLRGGSGADLEIRRLAVQLLDEAQRHAPTVFADFSVASASGAKEDDYGVPIIVAA